MISISKIKALRQLAREIEPKIVPGQWQPSISGRIVYEGSNLVVAHAHKGMNGESQQAVAESIILAHNNIGHFLLAFVELSEPR